MNILLNTLPLIATVFMTLCYIPQIVQTFKTKDVTGISLSFYVLLNISLVLLLVNSYLLFLSNGNFGYVISYIINEALALLMLILVLKYRKK